MRTMPDIDHEQDPARPWRRLLGEAQLGGRPGDRNLVLYGSGDRAAAAPHGSGGHPDIDTLIHW